MILTGKQEKFAFNLFMGMQQREAYISAGYSKKAATAVIDVNASKLANNNKIILRVKELHDNQHSPEIMSVEERKKRLSEIARARLTDYQESGQDGGWINIGPESPNTAALQEIQSTTKYNENGAEPTLITRIKLHNPINAIQELNKMEGVYSDAPRVNIDNRQVHIEVYDQETKKELTEYLNENHEDIQRELPSLSAGIQEST